MTGSGSGEDSKREDDDSQKPQPQQQQPVEMVVDLTVGDDFVPPRRSGRSIPTAITILANKTGEASVGSVVNTEEKSGASVVSENEASTSASATGGEKSSRGSVNEKVKYNNNKRDISAATEESEAESSAPKRLCKTAATTATAVDKALAGRQLWPSLEKQGWRTSFLGRGDVTISDPKNSIFIPPALVEFGSTLTREYGKEGVHYAVGLEGIYNLCQKYGKIVLKPSTKYGMRASLEGGKLDTSEFDAFRDDLLSPGNLNLHEIIMKLESFKHRKGEYLLLSQNKCFGKHEILDFMVKHGIPGAGNLLADSDSNLQKLEWRVRFANVDLAELRFAKYGLNGYSTKILGDVELIQTLIDFGFEIVEGPGIKRFAQPGGKKAGKPSMTIDQIRVFIRENEIWDANNRRVRLKSSEDEKPRLFSLRLWGALAPEGLPVYEGALPTPDPTTFPAGSSTAQVGTAGDSERSPSQAPQVLHRPEHTATTTEPRTKESTDGGAATRGLLVAAPVSPESVAGNGSSVRGLQGVVAASKEPREGGSGGDRGGDRNQLTYEPSAAVAAASAPTRSGSQGAPDESGGGGDDRAKASAGPKGASPAPKAPTKRASCESQEMQTQGNKSSRNGSSSVAASSAPRIDDPSTEVATTRPEVEHPDTTEKKNTAEVIKVMETRWELAKKNLEFLREIKDDDVPESVNAYREAWNEHIAANKALREYLKSLADVAIAKQKW